MFPIKIPKISRLAHYRKFFLFAVLVLVFCLIIGISTQIKITHAAITYEQWQKDALKQGGFNDTQITQLQNNNAPYSTVAYLLVEKQRTPDNILKTYSTTDPMSGLDVAPGLNSSGDNIFVAGLKWLLGIISYGILWLFSWLVFVGGKLLDFALQLITTKKFIKSDIVLLGWPIIRDLANMFFSLVLLIIAFATILRIETYGMKQVLWKLVVAALLINFSLTIAGVIIDGSNVLTKFFLDAAGGEKEWGISENLLNGLQVQKINEPTDSAGQQAQSSVGFLRILLNTILGSVFMLITAFVLFAAAILFYIRMVALWILLIFSPLAWLAMVLPATRSMWNKWWHEFFKWIIFAPVYAFFLYITLSLLDKGILSGTGNLQVAYSNGLILSTFAENLELVTNYVVLTIFLLAGLIFARQSGIVGATAMTKLGTNMRKGGMRMLSRWQAGGAKVPGADWMSKTFGPQRWLRSESKFIRGLARGFQAPGAAKRFLATQTNREVWIRAWATMKQRADENAFNVPAANIVGTWEQMKRAGGLLTKIQVPKLDENGNPVQKKNSEEIPMTDNKGKPIYETEEKVIGPLQALRNIFSPEKLEVEKAKQAITARRMQEYGNIKDEERLVHYYQQAKDPRDKEALLRLLASMNGINTLFRSMGKAFDSGKLKTYIQEAFTPEDAARIAADIQGIGAANNNYSYVGLTKWDPRLGKSRFTNDDEQEDIIRIKIRQMDSQKFDVTVHNDTFRGFDENGNRAFNRFGNAAIDELNSDHAEYAQRFAPRVKNELTDIVQEIKAGKAPEGVRLKEEFIVSEKAQKAITALKGLSIPR